MKNFNSLQVCMTKLSANELSTTPEPEGASQAPATHFYTSPTFKGHRGKKMPLLCPRTWSQRRTSSGAVVPEASILFCSCVGGLAFLPGQLKPDCQRIPAEREFSANVTFSQDKGRLGGVGWEDVPNEAWSHFMEAMWWKRPGTLAAQLDLLCVCSAPTFQKSLSRRDMPWLYILITVFD